MITEQLTVGQNLGANPSSHDGSAHFIFLAGPIERTQPGESKTLPKWRDEALLLLNASPHRVTVFNPEWNDRPSGWSYEKQVMWEIEHLRLADTILFWIPRRLPDLPAFTTNIEFGEWIHSDKIVVGSPPDAPHINYLRLRCEMRRIPWYHTLSECCMAASERAKLPFWMKA